LRERVLLVPVLTIPIGNGVFISIYKNIFIESNIMCKHADVKMIGVILFITIGILYQVSMSPKKIHPIGVRLDMFGKTE